MIYIERQPSRQSVALLVLLSLSLYLGDVTVECLAWRREAETWTFKVQSYEYIFNEQR